MTSWLQLPVLSIHSIQFLGSHRNTYAKIIIKSKLAARECMDMFKDRKLKKYFYTSMVPKNRHNRLLLSLFCSFLINSVQKIRKDDSGKLEF